MNDPLNVKNSIDIDASIEKVWKVLTESEYTRQYMFGCETVSEWKEGSTLLWRMEYEEQEMIAVKGTIKKIIPNEYLEYTTFDPNSSLADIPENYLTVTYKLSSQGNSTHLEVAQGDFNKVGNGQKRYKEVYNNGIGWDPILIQIKEIAEKK